MKRVQLAKKMARATLFLENSKRKASILMRRCVWFLFLRVRFCGWLRPGDPIPERSRRAASITDGFPMKLKIAVAVFGLNSDMMNKNKIKKTHPSELVASFTELRS